MLTVQEKYILDFENCEMNPAPTWITPELAKKLLEKNTNNYRQKIKSFVKKLCKAIKDGEWKINGGSISFAKDGTLIDGQNRLYAIAESGISVGCLIVEGVEQNCDLTINDGIPIKLQDHLTRYGETNVKLLATVIKSLGKYIQGHFYNKNESISYTTAIEVLERYPEIRDCVSKFSRKNLVTRPSVLAVCYFVLKLKHVNNIEMVDDFFDKLVNGNNLTDGEPLLILRNYLIASKIKGGAGLDRKFIASAIVKTWNYYLNSNPNKRKFTRNSLLKDSIIPKPL